MTDRDMLLRLAERVEAASGPDAAIDAGIADAIHWDDPISHADDERLLPFTGSIDAAMSLMPEGHIWGAVNSTQNRPTRAEGGAAFVNEAGGDPNSAIQVDAATPALALCAASLRARAAMVGE